MLAYPAGATRDAAEYTREALDEALGSIDRLRAKALLLPAGVLAGTGDLRPPIGATHPLRVAEAVTRLGGSPLDEDSIEGLEPSWWLCWSLRAPRRGRMRTPIPSAA